MWVWAPLMLVTLVLLLRAERHTDPSHGTHPQTAQASQVSGTH
jgi:hypothetical protein